MYKIGEKNIIVFPREVERVAISFIQGFMSGLIETVGYNKVLSELTIEGNEKVVERFKQVI